MADNKPRVGVKYPRIRTLQYVWAFRQRLNVFYDESQPISEEWAVWRGKDTLKGFPTHAEAIAYAQRIAHNTTDCTHRCGACRDLTHEHITCCPKRVKE